MLTRATRSFSTVGKSATQPPGQTSSSGFGSCRSYPGTAGKRRSSECSGHRVFQKAYSFKSGGSRFCVRRVLARRFVAAVLPFMACQRAEDRPISRQGSGKPFPDGEAAPVHARNVRRTFRRLRRSGLNPRGHAPAGRLRAPGLRKRQGPGAEGHAPAADAGRR